MQVTKTITRLKESKNLSDIKDWKIFSHHTATQECKVGCVSWTFSLVNDKVKTNARGLKLGGGSVMTFACMVAHGTGTLAIYHFTADIAGSVRSRV